MLSVDTRRAGETVTLVCIGRIVVGPEAEALEQIATAQRATVLVIDLAGVETIDASGLGTLVRIKMWSEGSGIALKLTNPNKLVREELLLTCLDSVLGVNLPAATSPVSQEEARPYDENRGRACGA